MSEIAIRCERLSKQYRLGQRERYRALRDVISEAAIAPFRRLGQAFSSTNGHFSNGNRRSQVTNNLIWALDDVSFTVERGEVIGIIGRNGAGKSTLLKILSRITKPTRGHAEINGRVGSLLEVGTGFHPELTGRENIYLNGAILGMRKAEIDRKFDEIVAFAEIEKFVDTPVKRYSSGMYVRLAFAVAAHMDTEVLLVDEVLAVGDAHFQRKCLGKMGDVAKKGRTVLFVSHNMATIQSLCKRALLLEQGKLIQNDVCNLVVENYAARDADASSSSFNDLRQHPNRHPGADPIFSSLRITKGNGSEGGSVFVGDDLILEFELAPRTAISDPTLGIGIDNQMGLRIFSVITSFSECNWPRLEGSTIVRCVLPQVNLIPGRYMLNISVGNTYNQLIDAISNAASFTIEAADYYGTGRLPTPDLGVVVVNSRWEFSSSNKN